MYLLFDVGGTNMRLAVSRDGETVSEPIICATDPSNFEVSMERFVGEAKKLTGEEKITAIAGGVPGPLNTKKTEIKTAPNMPGWVNQPLAQRLSTELDAPVFLENDTVMIGMGEAASGAGKGKHIVVYITVSTGVGGARIIDGIPAPSALGFEPGHQIIDICKTAPQCGCGGTGHLEALISGANLEKQYGKRAVEIDDPAVWRDAARYLAAGIHNTLVFWSPDIVILGGAVMQSIDLEVVRQDLREINTIFPQLPEITLSQLGQSGGLIGALAFASSRVDQS